MLLAALLRQVPDGIRCETGVSGVCGGIADRGFAVRQDLVFPDLGLGIPHDTPDILSSRLLPSLTFEDQRQERAVQTRADGPRYEVCTSTK